MPVGMVLDYIITVPASGSSYFFGSGYTYYISSQSFFGGTVAFYPGCVIKYAPGAELIMYDTVVCFGSGASPSILTSRDDDLFGEPHPQSSHYPTYSSFRALWDYYTPYGVSFHGFKIRWAGCAIQLDAAYGMSSVSDTSLEFCQTGVYAVNGGSISANVCSVQTPCSPAECGPGAITDVCSGDSDQNGLADVTEYQYFGRLGTLQGHVVGQLAWRTNQHFPNPDQCIFFGVTASPPPWPPEITRNPSCWLNGTTGLSSLSPFHDAISPGCYSYQSGCTLITPRHAITVTHAITSMQCFFQMPNQVVRFFDNNGNSYHDVHCLKWQTTAHGDICVLVFDDDLPDTVQPAKVLPTSVNAKMTSAWTTPAWGIPSSLSARLPSIGCNQAKQAFITDVYRFDGASFTRPSLWFPDWQALWCRPACNLCDQMGGDSGNPTYLLINNEMVLIGAWDGGCYSTWLGPYIGEVNGVIAALDTWVSTNCPQVLDPITGYSVTVADLSAFPDLR